MKENNQSRNIALFIAPLLVAAGAAYIVYLHMEIRALKKGPQRTAQEETRLLVSKVSQLILLPEGEEPTIATVNDPEKLKDQLFFARAQKGDKVLIYTRTKKAILYNPLSNKVIEVAPVNIGNGESNQPPAPKETQPSLEAPSPQKEKK